MTKEEILKAAEYCCTNSALCIDCPMTARKVCRKVFAQYIYDQEKEPAPPESDTSSQKKFLQEHNNTISARCQEKIDKALDYLYTIFESLDEQETNIWQTARTYRMLEEIKEELK